MRASIAIEATRTNATAPAEAKLARSDSSHQVLKPHRPRDVDAKITASGANIYDLKLYRFYESALGREFVLPRLITKILASCHLCGRPSMDAVDFGCGDLALTAASYRLLNEAGIENEFMRVSALCNDISAEMRARSELRFPGLEHNAPWVGSARYSVRSMVDEAKALPDQSIDYATSVHSLYYITPIQWSEMLIDLGRALRPRGIFLVILRSRKGDIWKAERVLPEFVERCSPETYVFAEDFERFCLAKAWPFEKHDMCYNADFVDNHQLRRSIEFALRLPAYSLDNRFDPDFRLSSNFYMDNGLPPYVLRNADAAFVFRANLLRSNQS